MTAEDCVFCAIAAGAQPSRIIYSDADTVAFLDITAVTAGHTLVIPKVHAADLWAIDPPVWTAVAATVHRVARRIHEVLRPDGLTLFQANRVAGWQDVFHLHVHLVPRTGDDGLHRPWTAGPVPLERLAPIRARLLMN